MLVVLLPLAWMVLRCGNRSRPTAILVLALAVAPAIAWYAHAYRTASPDGPFADRVFFSVRQSASDHRPPHPLLFEADFYRQMLDDLTGVVLTPVGFMLLLAGLMNRQWRRYAPWLLACGLLVLALPRKFYEMNYYVMAVLPPLCVLVGLGWQVVSERLRPGKMATAVLLVVAFGLSMRYAARPAFVTPAEDRSVLAAAAAVRDLTAPEEPVATSHGTGIALLYYCDRPGWAVDPADLNTATLAQPVAQGARYLVVVGKAGADLPEPIAQGEDFRVFRLPLPETR